MEYEKALFMVYERAIEGLMVSSTVNNNNNNNNNNSNEDNGNEIVNTANNNQNDEEQPNNGTNSINNNNNNNTVLPSFFLPDALSPYFNACLDSWTHSDSLSEFRSHLSLHYVNSPANNSSGGTSNHALSAGTNSTLRNLWTRVTSTLNTLNPLNRRPSFRRIPSSSEDDNLLIITPTPDQDTESLQRDHDSTSNLSDGNTVITNYYANAHANHNAQHTEISNSNIHNNTQNMQPNHTLRQRRHVQSNNLYNTTNINSSSPSISNDTSNSNIHNNYSDQDFMSCICSLNFFTLVMKTSQIFGIVYLLILYSLHNTYVHPTSLSSSSSSRSYKSNLTATTNGLVTSSTQQPSFPSLPRTCLEYALLTRPVEERSQYDLIFFDHDDHQDSNMMNDQTKNTTDSKNTSHDPTPSQPPLLGKNEILQIMILYDSHIYNLNPLCKTIQTNENNQGQLSQLQQCSRVWNVIPDYDNNITLTDSSTHNHAINTDSNNTTTTSTLYSPQFWKEPDYRFSTNEALMFLDNEMLHYHNVSIVNITMTHTCLTTGSDYGKFTSTKQRIAHLTSPLFDMDTIIINQLMYGVQTVNGTFSDGYVQNFATKERWSWSHSLLQNDDDRRHYSHIFQYIFNRIGVIVLSLFAFVLITSSTALIVRVLTSSGVIFMFPIFGFFRRMGVIAADDRILNLSYPWIGSSRRAIQRRGIHPQRHFVMAHIGKILLYYMLYEACQAAWSSVIYSKSIPAMLPLKIFGFFMLVEYFTLIFVRSASSAYFFPRITLLYFLCYHIYFYSCPYGFFDVALIPFQVFVSHAMLFTVLALEVPAMSRGVVSMDCPREVYTKLSWATWSSDLPHEWSIFMPLNARYIPLHDRFNAATQDGMEQGDYDSDDDDVSNEDEGRLSANDVV